ncbi:MAG: hypothetical protein OXU54_00230, partial [Gammaproteobacteria bacterium]|nr:hypothetical protein [Gammaproteobacteria bacterium]
GYPQSGDHTGKPDDLPTGGEVQHRGHCGCQELWAIVRERIARLAWQQRLQAAHGDGALAAAFA